MKLGVLLLYCKDTPRVSTFSRDWAERAVQEVADYIFAQSGGRESITFEVFEWFPLEMTPKEWLDLGFDAGPKVRPIVAKGLGVNLDPFTHIVMAIDYPAGPGYDAASGGTTPSEYTHLAAVTAPSPCDRA